MTTPVAEIRKQITDRIDEIEPLIGEYEQLKGMLAAIDAQPTADKPKRQERTSTKTTRRKTPSGRAPRGENKRRILEVVGDQPGVTSGQIADETGIDRRVVHTAVSKYKRDGLLAAEGSGVKLADNSTSSDE